MQIIKDFFEAVVAIVVVISGLLFTLATIIIVWSPIILPFLLVIYLIKKLI